MTQRYTPELAEFMKKRRYWFYVDGQRFTSAKAVNDHIGESLCHAAWRADLIAASGGESMKIGDRTKSVIRGKYTIFLERRDKFLRDDNAARSKLLKAGWSEEDIDELGPGQLYTEYRSELSRQKLNTPLFDQRETKYTRVQIRPAQGCFRKLVMSNWGNRCAITGTQMALEAAHIISHAKNGTAAVENGLCLAADLHTLMDSGHLLIEGKTVRLSDQAKADNRYSSIDGAVLRKPHTQVIFPVLSH
ncbi:HNH endonuclease [Xenorhabdus bovienii]|uniref:HNH endonuclease n=1 Tax=Xenorhabdus bovienii TaxID=40576 RepID=UPI0023B2A8D4|nr:HNH endonuclease signature motif containing protein [Xenorhabdus bovienii]MDE9545503.1 HNH endonuclease [Xenorhabdus bovienii]